MKQSSVALDQLARFVAVAEAGSYSRAAERLGVPKSTLSRAVRDLETALHVRLLQRTTRSVALSSAGRVLLERTAPLLAELAHTVGSLPELDAAPSGHLVVTAPVDLATGVLAELVARFVVRFPQVTVELRSSNDVLNLVSAGIDVALRIRMGPVRDSSLVARKLAPVHLHIYAAPSYLARAGTPRTPDDAESHAWAAYRGLRTLRLTSDTEAATLRVKPSVTGDDMGFIAAAVRGGAGLGALPAFLAGPAVTTGALVRVLPRYAIPGGTLALVTASRTDVARKVAAFRDFLIENLRL